MKIMRLNLQLTIFLIYCYSYSQGTYKVSEKWSFLNSKHLTIKIFPGYSFGGGMNPIIPPQNGEIIIDWGDTNIDTIFYDHSTCSIDPTFGFQVNIFQNTFKHDYINSGIYIAQVKVKNLYTGNFLTNELAQTNTIIPLSYTLNSLPKGFIGIKTLSCTNLSLDSMYQIGVPYDFTDNLGNTTTIYPEQNQVIDSISNLPWQCWSAYTNQGSYNIYAFDMINLPYTIKINQNWLNQYNYVNPVPNLFTPQNSNGSSIINPQPRYEFLGGDALWISSYIPCFTCPNPNNIPINGFFGFNTITIDPTNNSTIPDFGFGYTHANANAINQNGNLNLNICNFSCSDTSDVTVSIILPPNILPNITSLTNPTLIGNNLTFDIQNIVGCTPVNIPFSLPGSTIAGTPLNFYVQLVNINETNLLNNNTVVSCIVLNSYDPNFKEVNKPFILNNSITENLKYTIHFENEGNLNASNIKIIDTLSSFLNLSTFKLLNSSHPCTYTLDTNSRKLTMFFNSINLPSKIFDSINSKGQFSYSISEKDQILINDTIKNNAYIYFDFNSPIITNYTYNSNILNLDIIEKSNYFQVTPNPTNSTITIKIENSILKKYEIYDVLGNLIMNDTFDYKSNIKTISVQNLTNGMYFLKVNGSYTIKIIKED